MMRVSSLGVRVLVALAVLGALAFGAVQATASSQQECPYAPPSNLGACSQYPSECEDACSEQGDYQGMCVGSPEVCCVCLER
jgi:hypothetical protein